MNKRTHGLYIAALLAVASVGALGVKAQRGQAQARVEAAQEETFNVCAATGQYNNKPEYWGPCADVRR